LGRPLGSRRATRRRYVGAVEALWDNLRKVCGTCGMRYRDDAEGQKDFSAHMDWHFRRNALEKKKVLKAVSREWYLPANVRGPAMLKDLL